MGTPVITISYEGATKMIVRSKTNLNWGCKEIYDSYKYKWEMAIKRVEWQESIHIADHKKLQQEPFHCDADQRTRSYYVNRFSILSQ